MLWKPLLTFVVCLIGGIVWARSERNKRMLPIVIAVLPALDIILVQTTAIQRIYEKLTVMTTDAAGCTIGLGDFAYGGLILGAIFVGMDRLTLPFRRPAIKNPLVLAGTALVLMALTTSVGLAVTRMIPGVMVPQTPWVILGAIPFLWQIRRWWRLGHVGDAAQYRSEIQMMTWGWRLSAVVFTIGSVVFITAHV